MSAVTEGLKKPPPETALRQLFNSSNVGSLTARCIAKKLDDLALGVDYNESPKNRRLKQNSVRVCQATT